MGKIRAEGWGGVGSVNKPITLALNERAMHARDCTRVLQGSQPALCGERVGWLGEGPNHVQPAGWHPTSLPSSSTLLPKRGCAQRACKPAGSASRWQSVCVS